MPNSSFRTSFLANYGPLELGSPQGAHFSIWGEGGRALKQHIRGTSLKTLREKVKEKEKVKNAKRKKPLVFKPTNS